MLKRINDIIMKICAILILPTGLLFGVYDYLIWDKSIVPEWLVNAVFAVGIVALVGLIVTLILDKRLK